MELEARKTESNREPSMSNTPRTLKKSPFPSIAGKALYGTAKVRVAMWDRALNNVEEVQTKMLRDFMKHSKDTTFGRRYGFANIRSFEQYAARVPVGDYDSFSTAFEAMRAGETGVLVPEKVMYFGNSSAMRTSSASSALVPACTLWSTPLESAR